MCIDSEITEIRIAHAQAVERIITMVCNYRKWPATWNFEHKENSWLDHWMKSVTSAGNSYIQCVASEWGKMWLYIILRRQAPVLVEYMREYLLGYCWVVIEIRTKCIPGRLHVKGAINFGLLLRRINMPFLVGRTAVWDWTWCAVAFPVPTAYTTCIYMYRNCCLLYSNMQTFFTCML